jgi:hypothetical protein
MTNNTTVSSPQDIEHTYRKAKLERKLRKIATNKREILNKLDVLHLQIAREQIDTRKWIDALVEIKQLVNYGF